MTVLAIGEAGLLGGYSLAGVRLLDIADPEQVRAAWDRLTDDVTLVLLAPAARDALGSRLDQRDVLWVEVPA